jgi:hypothetical protein
MKLGAIAFAVLLVAGPLGGQVSLRYAGTAENTQVPGSPAKIELSLFARSDTISVGWLRIDPPLGGSGIAYTFSHPDSTVMVSISPSGDTIRWQSPGNGRSFAGEYSIFGGIDRGQSGTWSLTPERDPSRPILIAAAVFLGVAAVLGLLFLARRLQRRWWNWRSSSGPLVSPSETESLSGIGGWLAWHMFGVGLVSVYMLATFREIGSEVGTGVWMLEGVVSYIRPLLLIESAAHVFQLLGFAIGIYLVVKRRPETPLFFAFVLMTIAAYGIFDFSLVNGMVAQLGSKLGPQFAKGAMKEINKAGASNLRVAMFGLIWSLYWIRSKRVVATFAPPSARPVSQAA